MLESNSQNEQSKLSQFINNLEEIINLNPTSEEAEALESEVNYNILKIIENNETIVLKKIAEEIISIEDLLEKTKKTFDVVVKSKDHLNNQDNKIESMIASLSSKLCNKIAQTKNSLEDLYAKTTQDQIKLNQLLDQISALKENLTVENDSVLRSLEEIFNFKNSIKEMEYDLLQMQSKIKSSSKENESLKKELNLIKNESLNLKQENEDLTNKISSTISELEELKIYQEQMEVKFYELLKRNELLEYQTNLRNIEDTKKGKLTAIDPGNSQAANQNIPTIGDKLEAI